MGGEAAGGDDVAQVQRMSAVWLMTMMLSIDDTPPMMMIMMMMMMMMLMAKIC